MQKTEFKRTDSSTSRVLDADLKVTDSLILPQAAPDEPLPASIFYQDGDAYIHDGDEAKPIGSKAAELALAQTAVRKTINEIRAMSGDLVSNVFFTPDQGKYGYWLYDPADNTSADNLGTVLVTADGKRFKRSYTGGVIPQWFGYNPGMDDATAILQTIIDNFSSVLLQDGTYNINTLNVTSGKK